MAIERLSIELTNRCAKACWFCYSSSTPSGEARWTLEQLSALLEDAAASGLQVVSFGGGEPLESPLLLPLLASLRGKLARTLTTSGLPLLDREARWVERLAEAAPEKVHVSIHFPERPAEVDRVLAQVGELEAVGIPTGVNLLVSRANLEAAARAASRLREALEPSRIVYLPMRGVPGQTPPPRDLARVAGDAPFQSMSCLTACASSPRFASLGWDGTVAWCSYTSSRRPVRELTYAGLEAALRGLGLAFCGGGETPEGTPRTPGAEQISGAYSMDTDWYAVDDDGHVAVLFNSNIGPVPPPATQEPIAWTEAEGLLYDAGVAYDDADLRALQGDWIHAPVGGPMVAVDRARLEREHTAGRLRTVQVALAPDGAAAVDADVGIGRGAALVGGRAYAQLQARTPRLFYWLGQWLRRGAITRVIGHEEPMYGDESHRLGLYGYSWDDRGDESFRHPYRRVGVPRRPLHIADLWRGGETLQSLALQAIGAPLLALRFAGAEQIDVTSHLACRVWEEDDVVLPEEPAWSEPPPLADAGRALLRETLAVPLDDEEAATAVLADWLLEQGHPAAGGVRAAGRAFPAAFDTLLAAGERELLARSLDASTVMVSELMRPSEHGLAQVVTGLLRGGEQPRGQWTPRQLLSSSFGGWLTSLLAASPRVVPVVRRSTWLEALHASEDRVGWGAARARARAELRARALELLYA